MSDIRLIIFDCDGVLADSEVLSAGVLMEMMAEIGLPLTPEIVRSDFLGRSFATAAARTELRFGRSLPQDFQLQYRSRLLAHMRGRLQAMPGVHEMLSALRLPYCLATSSSPERLAVTLAETGLRDQFAGRSFTASQVKHGKPAPDLFLLAAFEMQTEPQHCLVIEDSEMGLRAGLAAGMTVWRFTGGSHMKDAEDLPDDVVPHRSVASMRELGDLLSVYG